MDQTGGSPAGQQRRGGKLIGQEEEQEARRRVNISSRVSAKLSVSGQLSFVRTWAALPWITSWAGRTCIICDSPRLRDT